MRKINALVLAIFYLLLSTGAFACIVHCASVWVVSDLAKVAKADPDGCGDEKTKEHDPFATHGEKQGHSHKKDDCGSGKNCNCCKKHGLYIVRENVSADAGADFVSTLIASSPLTAYQYDFRSFPVSLPDHPRANSPPVTSYLPIYLKVRSLLI